MRRPLQPRARAAVPRVQRTRAFGRVLSEVQPLTKQQARRKGLYRRAWRSEDLCCLRLPSGARCCGARLGGAEPASAGAGHLFRQLVDLLHFYLAFPIDDHTGEPLSDAEVTARHYTRLVQLQRLLFRHHPGLRDLALANCGTLQRRDVLKPALLALPAEELRTLAVKQLRCGSAQKLAMWAAAGAATM